MRDFESNKRRILDRVDILDLVSEHVTLKRSGRRWVGLCPFHAEKTPSFTVSPEFGSFKCFGCDKSGDVFTFIQLRENVPFVEAMHILADRAGVELEAKGHGGSEGPARTDLARVNAWALRFFRSRLLDERAGRSARAYLKSRQVSDATAERFALGLATDGSAALREAAARDGINIASLAAADLIRRGDGGGWYDTFRGRLMFPIRDATARVIGFGGRTLGDDRAKYLNTSQNILFDKGRNLYGIDLARQSIAQRGRAVLVEGYTDCLAAHQAGVTETVASLGTALTEAQVDLLRRYCDELVLLFDSDEAGEAAAERAIRVALPRCVTVRLARLPHGKDPAEFVSSAGAGEFSDLLKQTVDALEFKWLRARERFDGGESAARRREAVLDFLRVVGEAFDARAVDAVQRGLLVNQVAHLLRMDRGEVDRIMLRFRPRRSASTAPGREALDEKCRPAPLDAEQAAWVHLLEVLLNKPAALPASEQVPPVDRIADERDRRIAAIVLELKDSVADFAPGDVLARFQEPQDVDRVMELVHRGARRGNYERTLQSALERIHAAVSDDEVDRSKQEYFAAQGETGSPGDARAEFASFSKAVRRRHTGGFVARRLGVPRIADTCAPDNGGTPKTVEQA